MFLSLEALGPHAGDIYHQTMKGTSWYDVLLDGSSHGCYLEDSAPPKAGQERQLGSVYAVVDEVVTGPGGKPLIIAKRHPTPRA